MPCVDFFNMAVQVAKPPLACDEVLLRAAHDAQHQPEAQHRRYNRRQRHDPVRREHHHDTADEHRHGGDKAGQAVLQRLADGVHIVGDAGEHVAGGGGLEVADRQAVDFVGYAVTQAPVDLLCDDGHHQPCYKTQQRADDVENYQRDADFLDGGHVNLAAQPGGNQVGDFADFVRADQADNDARQVAQNRDANDRIEGLAVADELPQRTAEVLRLFARYARPAHSGMTARTAFRFTHDASSSFDS